jgi:alginate O-acetyltransferase complex protein AlgI
LHLRSGPHTRRKQLLATAVAANLGLLAYYKYAGFFASSIAEITGQPIAALHIILPIGISFFTFTQIAFLVDTFQGKVKESRFVHYLLLSPIFRISLPVQYCITKR